MSVGSGRMVRGARAARVKRLVGHGFVQGSRAEHNDGNCTTCEKRIQEARSWWQGGGGECDDNWEGFCFSCAEKRMIADEKFWDSYPTPKEIEAFDRHTERMNEELKASTPNPEVTRAERRVE